MVWNAKRRRVVFTDSGLRGLKPAEPGKRYEVADVIVPGLIVRVTDKGTRTFVLHTRFAGKGKNPTRRAIGEVGLMSLAKAREVARDWLLMLQLGKDPKAEAERTRREEEARNAQTFAVAAEEFIKRHLKDQRRGEAVAREIRRDLIARWGDKPVTEITRRDVITMLKAVKARAPAQAHAAFANARVFFSWAINQDLYGLENSPCSLIKPSSVLGERKRRQRVLSDREIAAFWRATERLGGTYAAIYRMLLLTGTRRSEVGDMRWSELDLEKKLWTLPPERTKMETPHLVPLTDDVLALLKERPRFAKCDFVFTENGTRPVDGYSIAKRRLDALMEVELGAEPAPWVVHDLRHTIRTALSSLRVPEVVAELAIGHTRKSRGGGYDHYRFLDELREALEAWERKLQTIVSPPTSDNVVPLRRSGE